MVRRSLHVHCELAPVLVNRTAVYRMCKAIPGELAQRGFRVSCSALLARLAPEEAEPPTPWERRLFGWSRQWLEWALAKPHHFTKLCAASGLLPRWRHGGDVRLFLDALYALFYGMPQADVVLVYDITTVTDPGWHPPGVADLYTVAFAQLARSRCQIVTSCGNTADQLRVNWGVAPSRLTVLPLAGFAAPAGTPGSAPAPAAPFFLFVGCLESRKNLMGLIQAYAASGLYASRGIRLRLVGMRPGDDNPLVRLARSTAGIDVLGFIDDHELTAAYRQCLAFVYPSFCEGFGLPLLEAMQHGCVCLSTTTCASPEVAGDAALYCNPYDAADIIRGLHQVASLNAGQRRSLAARARRRAGAFTWARFHDGLAGVLRKAAGA